MIVLLLVFGAWRNDRQIEHHMGVAAAEVLKVGSETRGETKAEAGEAREGLTAVISVKLSEPQFEGQTKTKLGNTEAKAFVQKVVGDRLRPAGSNDPFGVDEARARIVSCYGMIDKEVASRTWAMGEDFTIADCAAAPSLFYGNMVVPFGDAHKSLAAYFERLKARPSFARVLKEAEPYFAMVPK